MKIKKTVNCESIIHMYLVEHGYDGLFNDVGECACVIGDLMPCGGDYILECQPGYRVEGCSWSCGEGCDFHIVADISVESGETNE